MSYYIQKLFLIPLYLPQNFYMKTENEIINGLKFIFLEFIIIISSEKPNIEILND